MLGRNTNLKIPDAGINLNPYSTRTMMGKGLVQVGSDLKLKILYFKNIIIKIKVYILIVSYFFYNIIGEHAHG